MDPFGKYIAGPVFGREEIIYANLDLDQVVQSSLDFDVVGHYSRTDVFKLIVREEELTDGDQDVVRNSMPCGQLHYA